MAAAWSIVVVESIAKAWCASHESDRDAHLDAQDWLVPPRYHFVKSKSDGGPVGDLVGAVDGDFVGIVDGWALGIAPPVAMRHMDL